MTLRRWTAVGIAAAALGFAALAWQRRWMADDGLIFVRVARQILAGNGPVYNVFERAEPNTSTLWPWMLAGGGWLTGAQLPRLAVALGGALSVIGIVLAMDGTRRLHRAPLLVPCAVFVVFGVFPFWDYATSGLETGLTTCWIGAIWWLLVTLDAGSSLRRQLAVAITFGAGPLVRPDLAIVAVVFLAAAWLIVRPSPRRTLVLVAAAVALPLAYEVFRAGYYGTLVPLPAIAKGAAGARWARGFRYLWDYVQPHRLWLPATVLAALLAFAVRRRWIAGRDRIVVGAPAAAALLLSLYVLRLGGDFMHARMWLPPTLLFLLPALVVPLRRVTAPAVGVLAIWALLTSLSLTDGKNHTVTADDERRLYVQWTHDAHPIDVDVFIAADAAGWSYADAARTGQRRVIQEVNGMSVPMTARHAGPGVIAAGRLGTSGAIVPLDGIAADIFGLANPLGARITPTDPGRTAHEKRLSWAWLMADFAEGDAQEFDATTPAMIHAARHAMSCGELAELLDSVRAPLTAGRFWDNLTGALARTRLVIPADPFEAERQFCR